MAIYRPSVDGEAIQEIRDKPSIINGLPQSGRGDANVGDTDSKASSELVQQIQRFRQICGDIVNHPRVQIFIIGLIIINAIMMGVATFDFVTENPAVDSAFEKTDLVFLIIFTVELVMQLIYHGFALFLDGWLFFDFVIVVLSWSFAGLQIIRAFRIFRALRIITRIETMRNLVAALFNIMPRLGAITALLLLIFYIFGVLFTQLFGELELSGDYFTRLDYSLFTLFVMMTMEWADVARECMAEIWWAWAPFVAFIMITGFIVFNLIIAVVCDAVAVIENKDDLEPDLFSGMMSGSEKDSDVGASEVVIEKETDEKDIVDNLAERVTYVLASQRELLATLEILAKDSLVPTPQSK
mmetsp:Transcript_8824/g.19794  ORF Transcript_8824/g.19794 Transcript_8824/m.19794 type:complete len:355 (+) Transcript_8824:255-1319(+)